ncbi:MAG TPA: CYCXC family (seleno)protein [Longimicrobium sp.]|jgi:hypothetical protein|uniref:CYCXC family (seleno)protein n=1 Tax=Longimicrobium sp. TaxID=2029185 RepID=UPI002EDA666E
MTFPAARIAPLLLALLLCAVAAPRAAAAQHDHGRVRAEGHHPAPRPGVTGASVITGDIVPERAREVYTIAARIPGVLDALYCYCECHEVRGRRSLLECFKDEMAARCGICAGQARLADEMTRDGKSIAEIRKAIDRRFGD